MNGEPRDTLTDSELGTAASRLADAGERPLLEPVNTERVIQATVRKEDASLAPLFTQGATTDFRSRWDLVQRSFVDNPQEAVRAGDELVAQVISSLTETFSKDRKSVV